MSMDVVDYQIFGDDMQFVEVELDPHEAMVGEAGTMFYMEDQIEIETIFGDGSAAQSGIMGKLMGAGKRLLTGESLFTTVFTNSGSIKRKVAFSAASPGKIIPVHLGELGGSLRCQKDAFLCAAKGVSLGIAFQKKLGAGFFGGEGFVLQKLDGDGLAFIHAGGTVIEKNLAPGEVLRVDSGCVVAFTEDIDFDIQFVGSVKPHCLVAKACFSRLYVVQVRYGYNPCLYRASLIGSSVLRKSVVAKVPNRDQY